MAEYAQRFRAWLEGLEEEDLLVAAGFTGELRRILPSPGHGRAARRGLPRVRKEVRQASEHRLAEIAASSFPAARRHLAEKGYDGERITYPEADELRQMLCELPAILGPLALWGLLTGNAPAAPTARAEAAGLLVLMGVDRPAPVPAAPPRATESSATDAPRETEVDTDAMNRTAAARPDVPAHLTRDRCVELRIALSEARSKAAHAATTLRATADELDAGRCPGAPPLAGLEAATKALAAALDQVTVALALATPVRSIPSALELVDEAEQILCERAALEMAAKARDALVTEIAGLEAFLATLLPEARGVYESVLKQRQEALAQLDGPTTETGESAAETVERAEPDIVAASTPPAAPTDEPADESLDVPTPGLEAEHASTPETLAEPTHPVEPEHKAPPPAEITPDRSDVPPISVDGDAEVRFAFPWDAGSPPAIVTLVDEGRLAEAYWLTAASDESDVRRHVLRFAHAAFEARDSSDAVHALNRWSVGAGDDREAVLVEAAALLRCGLEAGWSHRYPALAESEITLPPPWHGLVEAASDAVRQQCRIERDPVGTESENDVDAERHRLAQVARRYQEDLPQRRNKYHRATVVQQWLLRGEHPLGRILTSVVAWAEDRVPVAELRDQLDELHGPQAADRLIDDADAASSGSQARDPIIAGARRRLHHTITEIVDLGREAVVLADRLSTRGPVGSRGVILLREAATEALANDEDHDDALGVGRAALRLFARWAVNPARDLSVEPGHPGDEVPSDSLLVLTDLPRHADRSPALADPATRRVLTRLASEAPGPDEAVREHAERGALDLAEQLTVRSGLDMTDVLDDAERRWRRAVAAAAEETRSALERVRSLLEVPDDVHRRLPVIAGRIEAPPPDRRAAFDLVHDELDALCAELRGAIDARVEQLRQQVDEEVRDPAVRARVTALLDSQDPVTAHEFLALHRVGEQIPEPDDTDPGADLREFVRALRSIAAAGADVQAWADHFRPPGDDGPAASAAPALEAWSALTATRERGLVQHVESVLRLLGLAPEPGSTTNVRAGRPHVSAFSVRATPRDGSFMPQLGSGARGRYKVLVVRDERRGRSPLDDLDPASTDIPYLVLFMATMSREMRRQVAEEARSRRAQVLVVDPPVIGWVAARAPGSFRTVQRLTLPWSAFDPYQPFVAGLVPSELFVGRESERRQIVDPLGGLFVYGGRQLGKSALLRRIEAEPGDGRTAVYLDLKGLGIGEAVTPDRIWSALAEELRRRNVIQAKGHPGADPDVVGRAIDRWLAEDPNRQMLVLADEADAFLTADSRGTPSPGGMAHFANMNRLKQLMDRTKRRFKIVFVGLHQVQRFRHLSNVPTPHGGPDILIGPLAPVAARRLVVAPLAALGYTFERHELVWRVLAATNYQPAPIQIFCLHLLAHLRENHGGTDTVPISITRADVDRVAATRKVRELIAERTRITVNLEDRYRVLALLIARKSVDDGFRSGYSPAELLEEAAEIWPEGFATSDFDEDELAVHLDEMEGLGLLARHAEERTWSLRSPNVVGMLGSREDFDRELSGSDFDLAYEYNPRLSRRLLSQTREDNGRQRRSPLSDSALKNLVDTARSGRILPVVVGTEALSLDRLPAALKAHLEIDDQDVVILRPDDGLAARLDDSVQAGSCVVLDLSATEAVARTDSLDLALKCTRSVIVMADGDAGRAVFREGQTAVVRLARWSAESIRSWPDCPFDTPPLRERLIAVTGGWPDVVENAVCRAQSPSSTAESVLGQLEAGFPVDVAQAVEFLRRAQVDRDLARALSPWVGASAAGEILPHGDLGDVLTLDLAGATELEDRLRDLGVLNDHPDGISLDQLTHRCLNLSYGL